MKIYKIRTKDNRTFRVLIENKNQEKRFFKSFNKDQIELFNCITVGINTIKQFEKLVDSLQ